MNDYGNGYQCKRGQKSRINKTDIHSDAVSKPGANIINMAQYMLLTAACQFNFKPFIGRQHVAAKFVHTTIPVYDSLTFSK
jgi:hypothetical protein